MKDVKSTNSTSNKKEVKGPVFLDVDFSQNLVLKYGEFSTDRLDEFGVIEIGQVQKSHNIIDDNMVGFRIIEENGKKRVEKIDSKKIAELKKLLEESKKELIMPIMQSEIDLIEKETGYKVVLRDQSLVIDDVSENNKEQDSEER